MTEVTIQRIIKENADVIEIGSASKGGKITVTGNFQNPDEFKERIKNAKLVRDYAQADIQIGNV